MKTMIKAGLIISGILASTLSWAEGTTAGTQISNTATATYYSPSDATTQLQVESTAELTVQEVIDISVTAATGTNVVSDQTDVAVLYTVSNDGNGSETFVIAANNNATGDDFDVSDITLYYDNDGDGEFTAADLSYPVNTNGEFNLDADETVAIWVISDVPTTNIGEAAATQVTITSQTPGASTATAGTVLNGVGDDDSNGNATDAIVAIDNAAATFTHTYTIVTDPDAPTDAVKVTKTVLSVTNDLTSDDSPIPGATITYQIVVNVYEAVNTLVIADTLPDEVTYVDNSAYQINSDQTGTDISSTGTALSDAVVYGTAADANGRVTVDLGNQATTATYTIQFQATIK